MFLITGTLILQNTEQYYHDYDNAFNLYRYSKKNNYTHYQIPEYRKIALRTLNPSYDEFSLQFEHLILQTYDTTLQKLFSFRS